MFERARISDREYEFQSLFFWMLLSKPDGVCGLLQLVGVDGFNPYFSGCFSLSVSRAPDAGRREPGFNPYFSGCFSLRLRPVVSATVEPGFNPYFSGCFSLSARNSAPTNPADIGFNPYFSGCFSLSSPIIALFQNTTTD